jgi:hypothetical protein
MALPVLVSVKSEGDGDIECPHICQVHYEDFTTELQEDNAL